MPYSPDVAKVQAWMIKHLEEQPGRRAKVTLLVQQAMEEISTNEETANEAVKLLKNDGNYGYNESENVIKAF